MNLKRLLGGVLIASGLSAVSLAAQGKQTALIVLNAPAAASAATTWEPRLGDAVTFTTDFPARLDRNFVYIQVLCYQNGALVFSTAGRYDRQFRLGGSSSTWLARGGPASCHADLYYWAQKYNQLAWTDFSAQG